MARVYSTQLLICDLGAGSSIDFDQLEVGWLTIVRHISGFFQTDEEGSFGIVVHVPGEAIVFQQSVPPGARMGLNWSGRSVHPGPTVLRAEGFGSIGGVFSGYVSGYVLSP